MYFFGFMLALFECTRHAHKYAQTLPKHNITKHSHKQHTCQSPHTYILPNPTKTQHFQIPTLGSVTNFRVRARLPRVGRLSRVPFDASFILYKESILCARDTVGARTHNPWNRASGFLPGRLPGFDHANRRKRAVKELDQRVCRCDYRRS